jgi:hypothetical protein
MTRLKLAGAILAAGMCAATASASTTAVFLHAGPNPVHRGHRVIIRGNVGAGCPVGDAVTIFSKAFAHTHDFAGLPAVFALVRPGGKFGIRPRIPSTKAPGAYDVGARCGGGNLGVSATIHVVA